MTPDTRSIAAAMQAGNHPQVEQLCRAALADHPQDENLLLLLAISLQCQQRHAEAVPVYALLTQLYPASALHWHNYGSALLEAGARDEAARAYASAIERDPNDIRPKIQLGLLRIQQQDYLGARDVLLDACDVGGALPVARIHAAKACTLCQDFHGADDLLRGWRAWLPLHDDPLQFELAKLLLLMSDAPSTAALLEDLVARDPTQLEAGLLLAYVYERLNRLDDARRLADGLAPRCMQASTINELEHVRVALALRGGDPRQARKLLEGIGPRHPADYMHYFQLAEACDKGGETGLAMQALETAHALQVRDLKVASPELFTPEARALPADVPRLDAAEYARWPHLAGPDARQSPVFIVGFPRSGTTLLEQMLDAHPGLQSMDENPFFNRLADKLKRHDPRILQGLGVLRQRDCDELRKSYLLMVADRVPRRWDAQVVDKNPLNMLWLPMIHRLFPQAKIIFAMRHPCDVILSCYMQNFRAAILGAACATLERLAAAYVQAMEHWLADASLLRPDVLVSRYEDLVDDVAGQAQRIATFLELDDAAPMLAFHQHAQRKGYIATPSYSQVIQPVNRKGLGRWIRYREAFEPVLPIVRPLLERWGYPA